MARCHHRQCKHIHMKWAYDKLCWLLQSIIAPQPKQLYTETVPLALQRLLWAGVAGSAALAAQQALGAARNSAPALRDHAFAQLQSSPAALFFSKPENPPQPCNSRTC